MCNKRSSGQLVFMEIRDGTGFLQAIVDRGSVTPEVWNCCLELTMESSVAVTGRVAAHPKKPEELELHVSSLVVISKAREDYPISKKAHGPDFLLSHRHLWLRSRRQWAIMRVRDEIVWCIRRYMRDNGFVLVDAPIITKTACEGTTDLFQVDYFGEEAFLSQSGQLYTEAAEYALGRTYCFGPTFRAEKSKTRRHLTEFWMVEPEMPFMEFEELLDFEEDFLWNIVQGVLAKCRKELTVLERDLSALEAISRPFSRITYTDAVNLLASSGRSDIKWGEGFGADDESYLSEHFRAPVLVTKFPTSLTSFFIQSDPNDERLSLNVDLLAPEGYGELIGGGAQRCADPSILESRLAAQNIPSAAYEWYLDTSRYGGVPHCGFGMGLERCVAWICGLQHVRESIPFPRMLNRVTP
jgi:asparaginyl-tRNA synthetase